MANKEYILEMKTQLLLFSLWRHLLGQVIID